MVGTFPDEWEEVALVTIQLKGGSPFHYAAITETIDIGEPDYPGESIPNLAGGRIWKQSPQEDGEVTFEIYPINLDTNASNGGLFQEFNGVSGDSSFDTTQPLATDIAWKAGVMTPRDRYIVAIMWTDDTAQTSALGVTSATDSVALRFYAKECRITSHKSAYTDGILKTTAVFKFPAFDKAGTTKSFQWESTNDGDTTPLPAITYT